MFLKFLLRILKERKKKKEDFDIPAIIDPLFEEDENSLEYT